MNDFSILFKNDLVYNTDRKVENIHKPKDSLKESKFNTEDIFEKTLSPEEILRDNNIKIRMVTKTSFGTQIDLAKKYDVEVIEDLLKDFHIQIKDKSIFVVI